MMSAGLHQALYLLLIFAAPPLLAMVLAGAGAEYLLARTSMRAPAAVVLVQIVTGILVLELYAPWIGAELTRFAVSTLSAIPQLHVR